jgi:hypothetical protein
LLLQVVVVEALITVVVLALEDFAQLLHQQAVVVL